ncbi:MAG: UV DNA damage repair endonuclease UvsE [Campylobacterota bacterium]
MNNMRLGLFCSTKDSILSTNRTFRLENLSFEKVYETLKKNLDDLKDILVFCKQNNIPMFRLGNAVVPFASHPNFEDSWWSGLEPLFEDLKKFYENFDIRLTIHPGQFIQLGSPKENVVKASLKELEYCTKVLDLLNAKDGVITLHIGGKNGNEEETLERFKRVFDENIWLQKYLALENDEYNFNARQTLDLCRICNIPMIFDIFHHSINPSYVTWNEIKQSWKNKRPKVHISSQGEGKIGTHAKEIAQDDFKRLLEFLGDDSKHVDIMVEAKDKEYAIQKLYDLVFIHP